ncbi:hypothetical protein HPHPA16_1038 [Helicobacter pylori Hp A-16]|nr:hypothetical protein HPHPA16_1038 [Helicobacter pylori Hp A-16]
MNHFKKFLLYSLKKRSKQLFFFILFKKYSKHFTIKKIFQKASDNLLKKRFLRGFSCGL